MQYRAASSRSSVAFRTVFAPVAVALFFLGLSASPAWAQAELSVNKTDSPDPVVEGDVLTYRIVVENTGEASDPPNPTVDTAEDVQLEDILAGSLRFVSVGTTDGDCTGPDPGDTGG